MTRGPDRRAYGLQNESRRGRTEPIPGRSPISANLSGRQLKFEKTLFLHLQLTHKNAGAKRSSIRFARSILSSKISHKTVAVDGKGVPAAPTTALSLDNGPLPFNHPILCHPERSRGICSSVDPKQIFRFVGFRPR